MNRKVDEFLINMMSIEQAYDESHAIMTNVSNRNTPRKSFRPIIPLVFHSVFPAELRYLLLYGSLIIPIIGRNTHVHIQDLIKHL